MEKEIIKNITKVTREHTKWQLSVITQKYSRESTLLVYDCYPGPIFNRVPDSVLNILRKKGYTRLYQFYIFTRIGTIDTETNQPLEKIYQKLDDARFNSILSDVNQIFFNYGEPANPVFKTMIEKRIAQEKQRILDIRPDAEFYYFGELNNGHPKALNDIQITDTENKF